MKLSEKLLSKTEPRNILITGKESYIGENLRRWIEEKKPFWYVKTLDVKGHDWEQENFESYDTVIHVAALVHAKDRFTWEDYRRVNRDLTIEIAKKSKNAGVDQFVFFSTMGVYGQEKKLPDGNVIVRSTPCLPNTFYARSKLEAEEVLRNMESPLFKVSILRPPNIYGYQCKGNYIKYIRRIACHLPFFPNAYLRARQGLLYIENLCELVRLIIEHRANGLFTPQDPFTPNMVEMIKEIALVTQQNIVFFELPRMLEACLSSNPLIIKLFGGISYSSELACSPLGNYSLVPFHEAIQRTVKL